MPVPMFAEKPPLEVQLSSNPKKRKLGHDDPASIASSLAAGSASSSLESFHNKPMPQKTPKRLRLNQPSSIPHHVSKTTTSPPHDKTSPKPIADLLLRPCHICWRRPTTRAVVDGYTDCDECGLRTCYICLRVCEDVDCKSPTVDVQIDSVSGTPERKIEIYTKKRRKRLCSWCIVEHIDADGDDMTLCLDCADHPQSRPSELISEGLPF